ncbi:MAG: peroxiredoxin family protein [Rubripirellula sp.]
MDKQRHSTSHFGNALLLMGLVTLSLITLGLVGCDRSSSPTLGDQGPAGGLSPSYENAVFNDDVESNREDDGSLANLQFVDTQGNTVRLDDYKNKQNVLLVFTRGFSGMICPYCTTQTSRLISNYDEFQARDAEVLLVYPGSTEQLPSFKEASMKTTAAGEFPFPVLLDENLAAVKQLGIASRLAYPSTFIIDKEGSVRLSYVGSNPADRPSIKAILSQLDKLQG